MNCVTTVHEHLSILRCPITGSSLHDADSETLATLNQRVRLREAHTVNGSRVEQEIDQAIISECGRYLYSVVAGVYVLLADLAIDTMPHSPGQVAHRSLGAAKVNVRDFYDRVGWQPSPSGYTDGELFEDLRWVSEEYRHRCNLRVKRHLPPSGRYLLDAASGPIQYDDYLDFSAGFDVRICVDLSMAALRGAKELLGDSALCILADVTEFPLQECSVDAAVSLHTIYHVPQLEQAKAFTELHRVLARGGTAVVVYVWARSFTVRLLQAPIALRDRWGRGIARARHLADGSNRVQVEPIYKDLYFYPQSYQWFVGQRWPFDYQIFTWRSMGWEHCNFTFAVQREENGTSLCLNELRSDIRRSVDVGGSTL
jgi:SAM-dependent methyltransferase